MALLFVCEGERNEPWIEALNHHAPDLEVRCYPDLGDTSEITYALAWKPPAGLLKSLPNLKVVFSLGAGIDHLASDPELPKDRPVVRMIEPGLTYGMTDYVVMSVLAHHRRLVEFLALQRERRWEMLFVPLSSDRRVGIMGLGELGGHAAQALVGLGFDVAGWSRGPKELSGVTCYHGPDGLGAFLARSEILVCLLPMTERTQGILCAETFAQLPRGAALVNPGRGKHLVETDLIPALDSGQLSGASLDVFETEPLPEDHPFWSDSRILITPHIAAITMPMTGSKAVIDNIQRYESGQNLENVVDFSRGY